MEYFTVGREHNAGKIARAKVVAGDPLDSVNIKDKCFLLIYLLSGSMTFSVGERKIHAVGPCFICFNERENPVIESKYKAEYWCIYFHPQYLNINMSLGLIRSDRYGDIATNHDLFLLKPFLDGHYVIAVSVTHINEIAFACEQMGAELLEQRDWYWSCRGRSYFMEIMIALERMYGLIGYGDKARHTDTAPTLKDRVLRQAILYIEGNYMNDISLSDIISAAGVNHSTLTELLKTEMGMTAMQYLMQYRVTVSKKHLAFTDIPIKTISIRCGFKTVQHFNRVFKAHTGSTPAAFRRNAVQRRKEEIPKWSEDK